MKSVLITGCSKGGIGDALAQEFHSKGLHVFATARDLSKVKHLKALGLTTLKLDVTSAESIKNAVAEVEAVTGGKLDFLVNNAGMGYTMPLLDASLEETRKLFELNVFSVLAVTQAFAPSLITAKGKIINIGSQSHSGCKSHSPIAKLLARGYESMAQPVPSNWNPNYGVDPRNLELNHGNLQLPHTESWNEVRSPNIGYELDHSLQYSTDVEALHVEFSHAALAAPDLEMQDQDESSPSHAYDTPRPLYDMRIMELGRVASHENSVPGVEKPAFYAETEHHLPQGNCGVLNSTVHWLDLSKQLYPDNGCAFVDPVPAYPFLGMESTTRGLEWDLMARSTSNDSSTQPAKSNIHIGSEKNAPKKPALKAVTFRKHKHQSHRKPQRSPPYIGALLGKRARLGVSPLDRGIPSQNETVNDGSAEPTVTDLHHVEQQHALALLKTSFRPSSVFSAQKFADLIVQIEQLVLDNEKYVDPATPTASTTLTTTVSSTRDSYSNSGVMDSGCPTDDTSVSSAPFLEVDDGQESSVSEAPVARKHRHCSKCDVRPLFYCTSKNCGYSTHIFTDWKRHEEGEKHWPQERFMCLECPRIPPPMDISGSPLCEFCNSPFGFGEVPRAHYLRCVSARQNGTTFSRKDHLIPHLREEHGLTFTNLHIITWRYSINSRWPRRCGFCETQFTTWDERMRHIAEHFEEGRDMADWKWPSARSKDFHPQGPRDQPKDDDSDPGNGFDGGSGGLRRRNPAGKRNGISSASKTSGGRGQAQGGAQPHPSQTHGHSDQSQGAEGTPKDRQHDVANPSSHPKTSVALEMYLNDPIYPIGTSLDWLRSGISNQPPGHVSQFTRKNDEDRGNLLRTLFGLRSKRINELLHSKSRMSLTMKEAPYRDGKSAIRPLEEYSIKALRLPISGMNSNALQCHVQASQEGGFQYVLDFQACGATFSTKNECTHHASSPYFEQECLRYEKNQLALPASSDLNSAMNGSGFVQPIGCLPWDDFSFSWPVHTTSSSSTPLYSDSFSDAVVDRAQTQTPKKRWQTLESPRFDALIRARKSRTLRNLRDTARVREKGACFLCKRRKKECIDGDHPDGPCRPCLERGSKITSITGLGSPLCWRPNIGSVEIFRRGPTIDFAFSLRGKIVDERPGRQAIWKHFAIPPIGKEPSKIVDLSQNRTSNVLRIRLDRYQPKDTDKQNYSWFDEGAEQQYQTPAYGIGKNNLALTTCEIEKFLSQNSEGYLEAHLQNAVEITRKTFHIAQEYKHLPLVESALKVWVGCRFIEEPWNIVSKETLGMSPHPNQTCPYHDRIPVPPIVDLQIDLIIINEILQPKRKKLLRMLNSILELNDPWTNWFEIYLAYFILLHNVEMTMAHDTWFVKRYNLKKIQSKYSNKNLVDIIMQGATTLLSYFHYAHQGHAPFSNPELDRMQQWTDEQKAHIRDVRLMMQQIGDCVQDPAQEFFWTSQLYRPDWRPVVF